MRNCEICNKPNTFYSICSKCRKFLPKYGVFDSIEDKINFVTWAQENRKIIEKDFCETFSFGNVHLDELHGYVAISGRLKNGKITSRVADVYPLIDTVSLAFPTKVLKQTPRSITAIVGFDLDTTYPRVKIRCKNIRKSIVCKAENTGGEYITFEYPGDFVFFQGLVEKTINNEITKYNKNLENTFLSQRDVELFKAKCVLFLDDDYTKEDLKKQRNRLLKVFHPDENTSDSGLTEYTQKITSAYKLLLSELGGK